MHVIRSLPYDMIAKHAFRFRNGSAKSHGARARDADLLTDAELDNRFAEFVVEPIVMESN